MARIGEAELRDALHHYGMETIPVHGARPAAQIHADAVLVELDGCVGRIRGRAVDLSAALDEGERQRQEQTPSVDPDLDCHAHR